MLITAFSILLLLSLASFDPRDVALDYKLRSDQVHNLIGPVGAHIGDLLYRTLGMGALFACSTFFYFGGLLLAGRRPVIRGEALTAWSAVLACACVLAHLLLASYRPFAHTPGGLLGEWVGEILRTLFATTGTVIIAGGFLGAAALALSGMRIADVARMPYRGWRLGMLRFREWRLGLPQEGAQPGEAPQLEVVRGEGAADTTVDGPRDAEKASTASQKKARTPVQRDSWQGTPRDIPIVDDGAPRRPATSTAPERPAVAKKGASTAPGRKASPPTPSGDAAVEAAPETSASTAPRAPVVSSPSAEDAIEIGDQVVAQPVIEAPARAVRPVVVEQDVLPLGGKAPFEFPSLSLLDYQPPAHREVDRDALNEAARTLEAKLGDFAVKGSVQRIQPGPVVTTFEFLPAPGVKISKIEGLANDLAMALKAQRVRIVAPIPGKGVVGIEVPSAVRETVYLKEILASPEFQESRSKLPIVLGKDIVGNPMVADLAKMPHVLVAGSTGSGKSVGINAIICSLVYRQKPRDLRLILVDPKILELSVYDDIPHLLLPVVTEPAKASLALKWAVAEMDRRYRLLASIGVRNLSGFNQKILKYQSGDKSLPDGVAADELEHLPYIVIILDELADLMMVSGKEVEQSIARLAQKARAAGIHLVVATQRPSTDVVTGLIKANFPTRISFMVTQWQDSKTILDRKGAENLLGRGDMLFLPPGTSALQRVQGCFVGDEEVERVATALKKFGPPDYDMEILVDEDADAKDLSAEDYDVHFDEAVAIVTETRNPSISYLQRRLKIGYNRSARIIERMEHDGIISKPDHRGVRKVMAPEAPPE
ncbi:MAG: S-DNA-T family DNA segregation ATPase FtsK/SpoIIIE [Myxococcota bacterium]|jgi:S-DNA-T family DNA segregation ATPase FtsK/SpoIIIE